MQRLGGDFGILACGGRFMLAMTLNEMALMRFGFGGGGGAFGLIVLLAIVGVIACAVVRSSQTQPTKQ
jgi:hypothetical protein